MVQQIKSVELPGDSLDRLLILINSAETANVRHVHGTKLDFKHRITSNEPLWLPFHETSGQKFLKQALSRKLYVGVIQEN